MVKIGSEGIPVVRFRRPGSAARVELVRVAELCDGEAAAAALREPQRPSFDLLIEVGAGGATHRVDHVEHRLRAGDLLWVRAGQVQQWGELSEWDGRVVLFRPEVITPASVELLRRAGVAGRAHWRRGSYPDEVVTLLQALEELDRGSTRCTAAAVEHVLEAILLRLCSGAAPADPPRGSAALYERFVRLLDERGARGIGRSVESAAQLLGCTPKTLTVAVREHGGRTAKQLIDERVILEAKRLLTHLPDAPVRDVAAALGFHDAANFSKFFKRHVAVTPAAFRSSST